MGDHLIVMHSAVRALPGYNRHDAPAILMDGPSVAQLTEQGRAVTAQLAEPHGTLSDAIRAAMIGLSAAGIPKGIRGQARAAAEDYFFSRLDLSPEQALNFLAPLPPTLELMPDPMYKALENIVELIVDGEYEELRDLSGEELSIEDLRRRVEDDWPEALVLPPREHYGIEALSRSEEPGDDGWAYFLDLWTEDGPARLHVEGEMALTADGRFLVSVNDILP
jgi:hypothetical protein